MALAQAQVASVGDIVFQSSGSTVAKITSSGVFEVSNSIKVGANASACSASLEGNIRYNSTSKKIEFCDATNWVEAVVVGTASADPTPDVFTFTDVNNQSLSALTLSDTLTIVGFDGPVVAEVSGGGSPQISINGGAWVTAGNINPGESLRVRLISSGSVSTSLTATVTVGTLSDNWVVTTKSGQTRIFKIPSTYSGASIGGLAGADAICQTEAGVLGYAGTWKALLSDSTTNAKDRLTITYPVVRASDGTTVEVSNLWAGALENKVLNGYGHIWTGTKSDGTKAADNCSDWTSDLTNGIKGYVAGITGVWLNNGTNICSALNSFYCIEQ